MEFKDWIVVVVPSIVTIIGFFINFFTIRYSIRKDIEKKYQEKIYEIKIKNFEQALNFIDLYLSLLTYNENGVNKIPVSDNKISEYELTKLARECYNLLCVTCEYSQTLNLFNDILCKEGDTLDMYNKFRNQVRKELSLKEVSLDEETIFYLRVSTEHLKNQLIKDEGID